MYCSIRPCQSYCCFDFCVRRHDDHVSDRDLPIWQKKMIVVVAVVVEQRIVRPNGVVDDLYWIFWVSVVELWWLVVVAVAALNMKQVEDVHVRKCVIGVETITEFV